MSVSRHKHSKLVSFHDARKGATMETESVTSPRKTDNEATRTGFAPVTCRLIGGCSAGLS